MKSEKQRLHLERLVLLNTKRPSKLKGRKLPPFTQEWKDNMAKARQGKHFGRRVKYVKLTCKNCEVIFEKHPAYTNRGRGKFCSRRCYAEWLSKNRRGEKHWHWKGGITPILNELRNCIEFKDWRKAVFKRDNYTCVLCHRKKEVSGKLTADHIKPFSMFPELRFDINNGRTLCRECHEKTDTWGGKIINLKKIYEQIAHVS